MNYKHFLYEEVPVLLRGLHQDTPAVWGLMNAQQMIEHLSFVVSLCNGRFEAPLTAEPERLAYRKMRFFEKNQPMPKGFRVVGIPETPNPMHFPDIEAAKMNLFEQLDRFDAYFNEHPDLMPVHPVFGPCNFQEWIQIQARHMRHHFEQFGLLEGVA
jgi:hypothetical protein